MLTGRLATRLLFGLMCLAFAPATAWAQSAIAGVVKDSSGAVMPGVTIEVASPALIEKVRSVVSDGQGQYKIVDLRPGVYSVTFTLPGFNTVKRDGVELPTNFTATINADLRVGALRPSRSGIARGRRAERGPAGGPEPAGARQYRADAAFPPGRADARRAAGAARRGRDLRDAEPRPHGPWFRRPRHHLRSTA